MATSRRVPVPPQDELMRRMRAARVLRDLTFQQLAELIPDEAEMGERVLRRLEGGEARIKPQHLVMIATAVRLPGIWFTAPTIEGLLERAQPEPGSTDE